LDEHNDNNPRHQMDSAGLLVKETESATMGYIKYPEEIKSSSPALTGEMGKNSSNARPHSGLLPRGEGETLAAFLERGATGLAG